MSDDYSGTPSTAAVAGHPIHPMLVPFPIAFLLGAVATDIVQMATGDAFWARASFWLLAAGLVGGVLAALAGLTDFLTIERVRQLKISWFHFVGNGAVMIIAAVNLALRWSARGTVTNTELVLSIVAAALLGVTGWLGGHMVYRHGVGMAVESPGPVTGIGEDRASGVGRRRLPG